MQNNCELNLTSSIAGNKSEQLKLPMQLHNEFCSADGSLRSTNEDGEMLADI